MNGKQEREYETSTDYKRKSGRFEYRRTSGYEVQNRDELYRVNMLAHKKVDDDFVTVVMFVEFEDLSDDFSSIRCNKSELVDTPKQAKELIEKWEQNKGQKEIASRAQNFRKGFEDINDMLDNIF